MKLTNFHLRHIIKEELRTILSEKYPIPKLRPVKFSITLFLEDRIDIKKYRKKVVRFKAMSRRKFSRELNRIVKDLDRRGKAYNKEASKKPRGRQDKERPWGCHGRYKAATIQIQQFGVGKGKAGLADQVRDATQDTAAPRTAVLCPTMPNFQYLA
tara:strand:+ start:2697 stop:3164 length:468 start_codon:yes stop_codon:yes gene_type:complete